MKPYFASRIVFAALMLAALSNAFSVENRKPDFTKPCLATTTVSPWTITATTDDGGPISRRTIMIASSMIGISLLIPSLNQPVQAAESGITKEEKDRLRKGYEQIVYLLDHFEEETTICRENGGECKRNSDAIRRALGLRSTTDPLFQIDKVFNKVKNMDLDPDKLEAFFEASEDWNSTMNLSNSLAFISAFGEYNPGGGQDQVLKYLNEAKEQVVLARNALKTIMESLDI